MSKFRYSSHDPKVVAELADRVSHRAVPEITDFIEGEDARREEVFQSKYKFHGGGYPKRLEQHPKWRHNTYGSAVTDPIFNTQAAKTEQRDTLMPLEHSFAERGGGNFIGHDPWMRRTALLAEEKRRSQEALRRTVSASQFSYEKTLERCLNVANQSEYEFWPRFSKYHYWGGLNGKIVRDRFLAGSHEEKDFKRIARGYSEEQLGMYRKIS